MFVILLGIFNFFTVLSKMHFSVRPLLQGERVMDVLLHGYFRDENIILHLMHEEQICPDYNIFCSQ